VNSSVDSLSNSAKAPKVVLSRQADLGLTPIRSP
jgi:hypothetical protein